MTRAQANLLLLLAAAIWGGGFVAQSTAMKAIGPFWFIALRFTVATLAVLPFVVFEALNSKVKTSARHAKLYILTGLALFGGAATQQVGLQTTTVTNSSFITGLYVVFVPLIAVFFLRRAPHWIIWPGGLMAVTGIYLLSGDHLSALTSGDLLTMVCAGFWAIQITLAGTTVSATGRPLALSATQFAVTAICALVIAAIVEPISLSAIRAAAPEIVYVGIFSSGLAFVLQVIAQRYTTPSQAAIFLSAEALFGASLAALLLGETMPVTGYAGCALMFIAMLVVELVPGFARRRLPVT
ncbi:MULTISPECIES: DMT family transporter [unclassified Rhizobium]|uniref:DMT family transporter n=1 Tax=unclassified Rhizobium TaxID=2613769 RepID=UPI001A997BC9|nr:MULTISPECIES: DMT family transporter [unclassified Rhizobium]MBX5166186.1 DMT family transporter [Rhizobium sp. NZLR4b]MBX5170245.1 DMT family transporter [Rhizobium sp. NZLR1b]MBX5203944.1 DMT family transporter [Rhizobium sp. NZLR1]MBX5209610.1 DMT family transporter [Rhizobium sp. NZLR11]QSZ19839.1 DMT family transporter [Rhizobium sp. NZLR1]